MKIFDPSTPSLELSIGNIAFFVFSAGRIAGRRSANLNVLQQLEKHLKSLGYRTNIATMQEIKIRGGSCEGLATSPYIPVGVAEGILSIAEARTARSLTKTSGYLAAYVMAEPEYNQFVRNSFEDLDADRVTVHGPRRVNADLLAVKTRYAKDYPFRRAEL